ncbi:MAG TPA: hypothetical protein VGB84_02095 [Arachidicoccus sp.]
MFTSQTFFQTIKNYFMPVNPEEEILDPVSDDAQPISEITELESIDSFEDDDIEESEEDPEEIDEEDEDEEGEENLPLN